MEKPQRKTLPDGTVISCDPERPYSRFLRLEKGPVTVRLSLTDAGELYQMLRAFFEGEAVVAVTSLGTEEPTYLPIMSDGSRAVPAGRDRHA